MGSFSSVPGLNELFPLAVMPDLIRHPWIAGRVRNHSHIRSSGQHKLLRVIQTRGGEKSGASRRTLPRTPGPGSPVATTCDADAVNEHDVSVANPQAPADPLAAVAAVSENPDAREGKQLENVETVKIARSSY